MNVVHRRGDARARETIEKTSLTLVEIDLLSAGAMKSNKAFAEELNFYYWEVQRRCCKKVCRVSLGHDNFRLSYRYQLQELH